MGNGIRDFWHFVFSWCFGSNMFERAQEILSFNPSTGIYATVWNVVAAIYENVCVPVGMGLVLIYFLVNLIERSMQQQQIDVEQVVKLLMKLVIGLYFIENGLTLMTKIYSMGIAFLNDILNATTVDGVSVGEEVIRGAWTSLTGKEWDENWGVIQAILGSLVLIFEMIIPFVGRIIINFVIECVCWFRLIEFYILTAMAPIAMSDFFTEGTHSNGWRFVKNYLAMALQMGVIMLAVVACNAINAGIIPTTDFESIGDVVGWITWFIKSIGLGAACCAVVLKSRSLAKEIVGAQ